MIFRPKKMIFRPFGAKKNKKNWIWKMTLADPSPLVWNFPYFFLNPSLTHRQNVKIAYFKGFQTNKQ